MSALNKDARAIQKEFLPIGTQIALLRHKLLQIGATQAMRHLDRAADVFHEDVKRIVDLRRKQHDKN